MADTTDELITVKEDELITAETTNKNNKYLETLMINYAGELRQYLDNQIQTLENEFQDDLTNLETTLQGSIDELGTRVDSISFMPDYSKGVGISFPYSVSENGYIKTQGLTAENELKVFVNGVEVVYGSGWSYGGKSNRFTNMFPVSAGDNVTITGTGLQNAVFFPMKGAN